MCLSNKANRLQAILLFYFRAKNFYFGPKFGPKQWSKIKIIGRWCVSTWRIPDIANCPTVVYQLAFLTADIFASFGVLPLLHLRAYTLQDATVYTCSYLYSGNFIISTVKSSLLTLF